MGKSVKLYFAYGMNTNPGEMAYRCPHAVPVGRAVLPGYSFKFNSFATIVPDPGGEVEGVLWTITADDEAALDILEGYPEFYRKKNVKVQQGMDYIAMTYVMNGPNTNHPPTSGYYSMVSEGYEHFGLKQSQLLNALPTALKLISKDFAD